MSQISTISADAQHCQTLPDDVSKLVLTAVAVNGDHRLLARSTNIALHKNVELKRFGNLLHVPLTLEHEISECFSKSFTIPFEHTKICNVVIDWGDGTMKIGDGIFFAGHNYEKAGKYRVRVFPNTSRLLQDPEKAETFLSHIGYRSGGIVLSGSPKSPSTFNGSPKSSSIFDLGEFVTNLGEDDVSEYENFDRLGCFENTENLQPAQVESTQFVDACDDYPLEAEENCGILLGPAPYGGSLRSWADTVTLIETLGTLGITSLQECFSNCSRFNIPLNHLRIDQITNLDSTFCDATMFNQPLHLWNTSRVSKMDSIFANAKAFCQDLNSWEVGMVLSVQHPFRGATSFKGRFIENWTKTNKLWSVYYTKMMANPPEQKGGNTAPRFDMSKCETSNLMSGSLSPTSADTKRGWWDTLASIGITVQQVPPLHSIEELLNNSGYYDDDEE